MMGLLENTFRMAVSEITKSVPHEAAVEHGSAEVCEGLAMIAKMDSNLICDQVLLDCSWTRMRICINDSLELAWPGVARVVDRGGRSFSYLPQHTGMGPKPKGGYDTNEFGPEFATFTFRRKQRPIAQAPTFRMGGWGSVLTISGPPCLRPRVPDVID
jgi:hypothetical protein